MKMRFVDDTDEGLNRFISHLRTATPLKQINHIEAMAVFREIHSLGYRILEPGKHPSGLATTEAAHTKVDKIGAQEWRR